MLPTAATRLELERYRVFLPLREFFFFFQAEDGIRDDLVTGVQTCALPISELGSERVERVLQRLAVGHAEEAHLRAVRRQSHHFGRFSRERVDVDSVRGLAFPLLAPVVTEIGRASCREGWGSVGARFVEEKE